ncbi:CRISPR-associated helicase Cas3' [Chitinolyticbacter meiyuanensis]|uniref:CRISPR-associated helicase Cas3' n=1 Tax=Chitinolyticbacter meiyuanensis TaxID=682798 RepID=UPI0011E59E0A|nr:CRISPR-associated helicase Cas3' [Chitinolyticbacter meiyuanensis]
MHADFAFFAHSTERADRQDWQLLTEHLRGVGDLAGSYAAVFGAKPLGQIAGLLHDLGKYTAEFQLRLCGGARVDHATWGARIAVERFGSLGTLLAYGIAGHHAGLANGRDTAERTSLQDRLRAPLPELNPQWQQDIALPATPLAPSDGFKPNQARGQFQLAFLGRMLFSCLVDADFIDTEAFYQKVERRQPTPRGSAVALSALRERLNHRLASFKTDTPVNRLRGEILAGVRSHAADPTGVFSLTVPTGGGKTLASLAFALDHAIAHGLRRVIFVIPFTSIVEQTAAVFRDAFGELGEAAVLEHHSAFVEPIRRDDPDYYQSDKKLRLAMENWDYPIVVTTSVQFFESLYADRPARCRKLHNIAGSVVILDEAQTLPLKLLRPCVAALDELARNYRSSVVLCTATQPALHCEDFVGGFEKVTELAPDPEQLFRQLERVTVRHVGVLVDAALAEMLRTCEQALCIVNNRRHARALFDAIADEPGARHLTTLMCAKHRSAVLADIRADLKAGRPCRLVATSLIEAGVDVDFPIVLRAEAGLDSIAQAAGRCNREGRRNAADSEVLIFATDNPDWAPPPELTQFAQTTREVLRRHGAVPLSQAAIKAYFTQLYWQKGEAELDAHGLLGAIEAGKLAGLPYELLASKFRMIESAQLPVIVPFDDTARTALRELEYAEGCGGIARRLQPYLVQLPRAGYQALRNAGAIQPVQPERFGEQFMQLVNPDLYDDCFGLSWENPAFIQADRLVWAN